MNKVGNIYEGIQFAKMTEKATEKITENTAVLQMSGVLAGSLVFEAITTRTCETVNGLFEHKE